MEIDFNNEIFNQFSKEEKGILQLILSNAKESIHLNKKITFDYTTILKSLNKEVNSENKNWLTSMINRINNKHLKFNQFSFSFFQGVSIPLLDSKIYVLHINEMIYEQLFLPLYNDNLDIPLQMDDFLDL